MSPLKLRKFILFYCLNEHEWSSVEILFIGLLDINIRFCSPLH